MMYFKMRSLPADRTAGELLVVADLSSVSVIIPTKNRPADLRAAVQSLLHQMHLPVELIIVDQSAGDASRNAVEQAYGGSPGDAASAVNLVYVHDPLISGLAEARNRAMDAARGDIWLFLDDDVVLEPGFTEELRRVYNQRPDAAGVSGIVTNYTPDKLLSRIWSAVFVRGPFSDPRRSIYWQAERLRGSGPVRVDRFTGAFMSFRAAALSGARFDENLSGVSDGEDVDFCQRLGRRAVLLIAPRARLAHHVSPIGRETAHSLRRDARSVCYLYRRNWRHGVVNRIAYAWLICGFALAALVASARRRSASPWRALWDGVRDASAIPRGVSAERISTRTHPPTASDA